MTLSIGPSKPGCRSRIPHHIGEGIILRVLFTLKWITPVPHKDFAPENVSFFGWGFIIPQVNKLKQEHPVAFESEAFQAAPLNHTVGKKELLAIVDAFRRRRHLLLQVETTVLTDPLNLMY
ncbi:hypothetical protein M231_07357 [Tremella mesenterica]|uniref:Reverse transcriptase RNase H-like domain-containing protein n=1 Tax=Tremella mesenterica TaxID=5217 RepID=A0A4Q1BC67_TREME|nr:hypothetical protein M231_07357 [Tremella mesenterica]